MLNLLRLDPDTVNIPVIVASVDSHILKAKADLLKAQRCEVMEKPFALADLLTKVKSVIHS